jgi:hypothetical protein
MSRCDVLEGQQTGNSDDPTHPRRVVPAHIPANGDGPARSASARATDSLLWGRRFRLARRWLAAKAREMALSSCLSGVVVDSVAAR